MLIELTELPLGRRLKVVRVSRDLRQRDVALSAGLTPSTLSLIETGDRTPDDLELAAILKVLDIRREDVGLGEVLP